MRKTTITLSICMTLLMLAAVPNAGAAICASTGTVADLIALGAGGCTLGPGNDKLFNNFTFIGSNGGTSAVSPTALGVTYVIENPGTSTLTGQSVYGFIFNPGLGVIGSASSPTQIQDALLGYDISIVNPVVGGPRISSIHLFETALATGTAVASVTETDFGCVSVGVCSVITDSVSTSGTIGQHNDILGLSLISLHVSKDINVVASGAGSFSTISAVRDSVDQSVGATATPEPATLSYMLGGIGLAFVGMLRRRRA